MTFRESMMNVTLPSPLDVYLNAEANSDTAPLVHCFASDAVVHDEGRTIKGLAAIQAWKKDSKARYQYVIEPLDSSRNGDVVTMRARLTGSFPGSPLELTYTFVLADGKIASLEIR